MRDTAIGHSHSLRDLHLSHDGRKSCCRVSHTLVANASSPHRMVALKPVLVMLMRAATASPAIILASDMPTSLPLPPFPPPHPFPPPPPPPSATSPVQVHMTQKALIEAPDRFGSMLSDVMGRVSARITPMVRARCEELLRRSGSFVPLHTSLPCIGSVRLDCSSISMRLLNESVTSPTMRITEHGLALSFSELNLRALVPVANVRVGARCPSQACACDREAGAPPGGNGSVAEVGTCSVHAPGIWNEMHRINQ